MHFHVTNLATNSVSLTDPLALACVMIQPPTSIIFSLQAYCQRNRGEFVGDFPNGYIDFVLDDFDKESARPLFGTFMDNLYFVKTNLSMIFSRCQKLDPAWAGSYVRLRELEWRVE